MHRTKLILVVAAFTSIMLSVAGCGVPATTSSAIPSPTASPSTSPFIPGSASTVTLEPASPGGKVPVIYDDDGSWDGTTALLYLLSRPEVSVQAIVISYGEAHPEVYIQHVGRLLDEIGIQDIPLGAGQDAPLAGGTPFPDWLRTTSDNYWDVPLPNKDRTYPFQYAPDLIVATLKKAPAPVTIFVSGPFTSLAQALRSDPAIKEKIAAVYFMGGAVQSSGNITNLLPDSSNAVAEWNIIADPQAAKEVFDAGLDMYMVPLDATGQVKLRQADILPWYQGGEIASLVAAIYDPMYEKYGREEVEIFDLTAAALLVSPQFCAFQSLYLDVITASGNNLGQTAVVPDRAPNMHACLNPDANLVKQALNDSFAGSAQPAEIPSIDPLIATWTGSVFNNGLELQMSITIMPTCQLGQLCGQFDMSTISCSGTLTWVGMEEQLYQFQAGDKTEACGEGRDYLLPQTDGTVIYIGRGAYGETNGTLQRVP